jgi:hypothetical protein
MVEVRISGQVDLFCQGVLKSKNIADIFAITYFYESSFKVIGTLNVFK